LSGPKQWEEWFSTHGSEAVKQENTDFEAFRAYMKEREWALTVHSAALENELLRQLQRYADERGEGLRGALATVPEGPAAGKGAERRRPFAVAVNEALWGVHEMLADKERVAAAGGGSLEVRISTLEFLVSQMLPCLFADRVAAAAFEEIARCIRSPRSGLCSLIHDLLSAKARTRGASALMSAIDAKFAKVGRTLRKLLDFINVGAHTEVASWAEACYNAVSWALTATDADAWPEPVAAFKFALAKTCNHTPGRGRGCVIRTSAREMTLLLHELRSAFRAQHFQGRYQELRSQVQRGDRKTHGEMIAMVWEVHRSVIPRYGFEPSPAGVTEMFDESDFHADFLGDRNSGDKLVAWLRLNVCQALEVEILNDWNYGGRKFEHMPQFHTVGDSHSTVGWPAYVNRHFQGPLLCYNVGRVDVRELSPPVQAGDALCFCLGEIDCRVQVHKRCSSDVTYQQVIDGIISRYFNHIRQQERLLPAGVRLLVFNVPPPQYRSFLEHSWIGIPCRGEDEERRSYVLYFNKRLKEECCRCGFEFFDVYDKYTDERGFLDARYSDSTIHISDGTFLDEFIKGLRLKATRKTQVKLG